MLDDKFRVFSNDRSCYAVQEFTDAFSVSSV